MAEFLQDLQGTYKKVNTRTCMLRIGPYFPQSRTSSTTACEVPTRSPFSSGWCGGERLHRALLLLVVKTTFTLRFYPWKKQKTSKEHTGHFGWQ